MIDLLSNKLWKKTKKSFSQKDGYYDVRNLYTGPEHSSEVIGAYVTVGLYDTLGQIRWPDGSVHIYDSGLEETRWVPRDEIKLFDLEHKELISRIILDCLDRADSLLSKRTGSDEYIRLRFTKGEENEDVVLFRDGAVYGNAEMIDTAFVDLLAGELKRMNEAA